MDREKKSRRGERCGPGRWNVTPRLMSEAVATPEARLASPSEVALVPTSLEEEGGLTPFLQGSDPMLDEAVRAEKARVRAEKKAQRRALNKRALVDPIISSKRLEVYGRWMSRKTAKFKVGFEGDPKSGTRRSAHGVVSLLEVAGGEQMFKLSFQGLYLTNPDDSPLYLYVTTRKARKTTGDVEQHCTRVEMDHRDDGCIGHEGTSGNIEQVLTGIDDPVQLRGLYIIKPARAKPETSEAVIFAFGNMEDFALEIPVSSEVLGVQAARDGIDQLKARIEAQRGRAAVQGGDQSLSLTTVRRQAQRAWRKFGKSPRLDSAKFEEFKDMLNYLDIIVLEPRAVKLFSECDLDHSKHIEIGELEIALLMNASLPPDTHLTPTDAFATFDLDGTGFIDELEFMEAIQVLGIDISTPKREKKVTYLFGKIDKLGSATVDQGQFLQLWAQLVNAPEELRGRGIPPAIGPKSKKRNVQKLLDALAQEQVDRDAAFHRVKMDAIKLKYDERKRQQEKARELMLETTAENREAKREQAKRDKAERIRRRKEQEEIIKREQREAQLKRKMEDAKLERERKVQEDFHNERVQKAEQELVERRKRREDRIELAQMGIRDLPASVYEGKTAQFKLSNLISIDVSRNKLTRWPEKNFMFWLASLRRLDMSHNRFAEIPGKELDAMGELQILRLNNNVLRHLPDTLGGLHSLQRLDLSQNHIAVLPSSVAALSRLEVLNLSGNELVAVPHQFGDLEALRTCDLSKNRLFELPDEFPLLHSLTKLDLSGNVLVELPEDFGAMTTLRSLNCSGNRIVNIPETFRQLHLLDALSFRDNSLRDIDAWVGGMHSLVELDMSSNLVQHVDPHISTLGKLQYLDLSNNKIVETPKEFGMMTSLEVMKLQRNAIPVMLPEIGGLQQMHHLDMSHSKIQGGLPPEFGLLQLLVTCDLSYNMISEIPPNIAVLVRLELFDASHNQLTEIPSAIENLTALRTLNLASNRLESLPLALGPAMHSLERLDISCNRLTELPQPLCEMPALIEFDVYNNRLTALPCEFANIVPQLKKLNLSRNPFSQLPAKWCSNWELRDQYMTLWSGYRDAEAVDWAMEQGAFYPAAKEEWEETGQLHYAGKSSLEDFLEAVMGRLGDAWEERFVDMLTPFYFNCKQHGVVPRYDALQPLEREARERERAAAAARREERVARVRQADHDESERMDKLYKKNLASKIFRAEHKMKRAEVRQQKIEEKQLSDLRVVMETRMEDQQRRFREKEAAKTAMQAAELKTLTVMVNERNANLIMQRKQRQGKKGGGN